MIAYIYIQQIIAFYQFRIMQYLHLESCKRLHISNSVMQYLHFESWISDCIFTFSRANDCILEP